MEPKNKKFKTTLKGFVLCLVGYAVYYFIVMMSDDPIKCLCQIDGECSCTHCTCEQRLDDIHKRVDDAAQPLD